MLKYEPGHLSTLKHDPRVSSQYLIVTPSVSFQWSQNLMLHIPAYLYEEPCLVLGSVHHWPGD